MTGATMTRALRSFLSSSQLCEAMITSTTAPFDSQNSAPASARGVQISLPPLPVPFCNAFRGNTCGPTTTSPITSPCERRASGDSDHTSDQRLRVRPVSVGLDVDEGIV